MKNILLIVLILICSINQLNAQAKKPVAKKPIAAKLASGNTTSTVPKTSTAKTNNAVAKPKVVTPNKMALPNRTIAKKTAPAKTISKPATATNIPNKPVNNAEITTATVTSREQEMINEINNLRSNPTKYCTYVEMYLQKNDVDAEVKVAAKELMSVLKKMQPLNPLSINQAMYNDARQYGLQMAKKNIFEHSSLPYAENLSLGYKDIRDAIVDLLIDEGIPDRGHRKNLLNEKIKNVAVYELPGKVQDIAYCYVQEFK